MPRPKLCRECDTTESCASSRPRSYQTQGGGVIHHGVCYRSLESPTQVAQTWSSRIQGSPTISLEGLQRILAQIQSDPQTIKVPTTQPKPRAITQEAWIEEDDLGHCLMLTRAFQDKWWPLIDQVASGQG